MATRIVTPSPSEIGSLQSRIRHARTISGSLQSPALPPFTNIGHLLHSRSLEQPDNPWLIFYSDGGHRVEYSYHTFAAHVSNLAQSLRRLGIQRGDRIATVSHNHSDTVIQYFAAWSIGAVVIPINVTEDDKRISYILRNSNTVLAFVRDLFLERVIALPHLSSSLRHIVNVRTQPVVPGIPLSPSDSRVTEFSDDCQDHSPESPDSTVDIESEALIVYTSGTTGMPKGVVLTQANLLADALAIASWHRLTADERMMCVLPIHHVNGTVVTIMTPMVAGGSVVLNQKFQSKMFFERIGRERVHIVSVVPTLLQFLLHEHTESPGIDRAVFRHLICGAGPLTVELAAKFEERFGIRVVHGYGLSETTCYSCFLPIDLSDDEHRQWMGAHGFPSIGVPLPINEMAIHNEAGERVKEGERGEIVIRGVNVMKEYFANEEANEKAFTHGWFRSGDEGFYRNDDRGRPFFFITGRIKELIIRGGVNISPYEIDEVLMNIPGVKAGLSVGFENDWYGEEIGAYVQPVEGSLITESEIIAHCRSHFPYHKTPKVVLLGDDIPVTSTGKYQRGKLRPLFERWKGVQFTEPRDGQPVKK